MRVRVAGVLLALAVMASPAYAQTTRTVCASGCDYTSFQSAITAAVDGDTIALRAGETFTGNFTLPNKGVLATGITITSDPTELLPADGVRITPESIDFLPMIVAPAGGSPALTAQPGANGYFLEYLYFQHNPAAYGDVIAIGGNTASYNTRALIPYNIHLRHIVIAGNPYYGQKRGISLNGNNVSLRDSHIADMMGFSQDAMAVQASNTFGPITIENNYLEASAYAIMLGGDDPAARTVTTVTSPTTTQATLASVADLEVGQLIAFGISGSTSRVHTVVRSINPTTRVITYDAVATVPDSPGDARWGAVANNVTISGNHITKKLAWRNPVLGTPGSVSTSAILGAGSLAAGTYYYRVTARITPGYQTTAINSAPSVEVSRTLSGTGSVSISWAAVPGATGYRIFGRASTTGAGDTSGYWDVTGTTSYTDTGTAPATPITISSGSKPVVKNLMEIKCATNATITSNIMENTWQIAGVSDGYALWLKSNWGESGGGDAAFCSSDNLVLEKNIIRSHAGFLSISSPEYSTGTKFNSPKPIVNLTVRNNIVYDASPTYSDTTTLYLIRARSYPSPTGYIVKNFIIDHNTMVQNGLAGTLAIQEPAGVDVIDGLTFTNNIALKDYYGVYQGGSGYYGSAALAAGTLGGSYTFSRNVIAGATCSASHPTTGLCTTSSGAQAYPLDNWYPTVANFQTGVFVDYASGGLAGDYHIKPASVYLGMGTDSKNPGADIDLVLAATADVLTGSTGTPTTDPPRILTTSLPSGVVGTLYSQGLAGADGTTPYAWSITTGTLPAGLTLNATTGVILGTPTSAGTYPITARLTDADSRVASQSLSILIAAAPLPPDPPEPPESTYFTSLTFDRLASPGDLVLSPTGGSVMPETGYLTNLGSLQKKYLTLHAAELWVETLVAQNTMATIGGRIIVAPTTTLTTDLAASGTTVVNEVVIHANTMTVTGSRWALEADATAADGFKVRNPNLGEAIISTALDAPASYVEATFTAEAGKPYHLWLRMKADNDHFDNDTVWMQFDGTVTGAGLAVYRIGTTDAAVGYLQNVVGGVILNWGWNDNDFATLGAHLYFATTGTQTIRIQQRQDGTSIDQIVLSAVTYLTTAPGPAFSDTTILEATTGSSGGGVLAVKHNNLTSGDVVYLEANGAVEFMQITGGPTGTGPYAYSVSRNLDGSGANDWTAGDAVLNTGQAGNGFMDIYSTRGTRAATEVGPTVVGNVRQSSTFNDWAPRYALGNLRGLYGYSANTYGAAFGNYAGTWIAIDAANGIRIMNGGANTVGQWDAAGNILIGSAAVGQSNVFISGNAVRLRNGTTQKITLETTGDVNLWGDLVMNEYAGQSGKIRSATATGFSTGTGYWLDYNAGSPQFRVGNPGGQRLSWDGSTLEVYSGSITINSGGISMAAGTIGNPAGKRIAFGNVELYAIGSNTLYANGDLNISNRLLVNSSGVTVSAPLTLNSSVGVPGIQSYAGDLTGSVLVLDGSNQMKKIQSATADFGVNDTGCASGRRSLFFRRGLLHSTYCQ
jgi:hypothetical protein